MYRIFLHTEVFDVHLNDITHNVVEHEKTGSFLDVSLADEIEDRSDDFIHALHILNFRVEPCKNKKYSCNIVVPKGYLLLLMTHNAELVSSRY